MAQPGTKTETKVTVEIRLGPASPEKMQAWKRFWSKVISMAEDEVKSEQQRNQKSENESE